MNIESLAPDLLWQLKPIGEEFTELAGLKGGFDINIFASNWRTLIAANLGRIYVVRDAGVVVGCLGCVFIADPFNGRLTAVEQFWFVLPDYRRGRAGLDLLDAFEKEATQRGCKKVVMVHLEIANSEVLEKLYQRRGFVQIERTYAKEI